jgi:hypothetical protein
MNKNHSKQKRDNKGRFLSYDGTKGRKFTIAQIKDAFLAGANSESRLFSKSQLLHKWLKARGYND